jgi:hypothetical protein
MSGDEYKEYVDKLHTAAEGVYNDMKTVAKMSSAIQHYDGYNYVTNEHRIAQATERVVGYQRVLDSLASFTADTAGHFQTLTSMCENAICNGASTPNSAQWVPEEYYGRVFNKHLGKVREECGTASADEEKSAFLASILATLQGEYSLAEEQILLDTTSSTVGPIMFATDRLNDWTSPMSSDRTAPAISQERVARRVQQRLADCYKICTDTTYNMSILGSLLQRRVDIDKELIAASRSELAPDTEAGGQLASCETRDNRSTASADALPAPRTVAE